MTKYKIRKPTEGDVQFSQTYLAARVGIGLPHVNELANELDEMRDVIFSRIELDYEMESPYLSLMEVSTAYYARSQEINELILRGEREGVINKGSQLNKFRTGELRAFIESMCKIVNLGSRRLTNEQFLHEMREVG